LFNLLVPWFIFVARLSEFQSFSLSRGVDMSDTSDQVTPTPTTPAPTPSAVDDGHAVSTEDVAPLSSKRSKAIFVGFMVVFIALGMLAGAHRSPVIKWVWIPFGLLLATLSSRLRAPSSLEVERKDRDTGTSMAIGCASMAMTAGVTIASSKGWWTGNSVSGAHMACMGFLLSATSLLDDNGPDTAERLNTQQLVRTSAVNMGVGFVIMGMMSGILNSALNKGNPQSQKWCAEQCTKG
jgi:hypothetical protein